VALSGLLAPVLFVLGLSGDPGGGSFDALARRAASAREEGRLDEASRLYREALSLRPRWAEGLWYLGTLAYEQDRHAECRDSFRRLVALQPKAGSAWALRGLCEARLREFGPALAHLEKGLALPPLESEAMERVALYHQALLLARAGRFEEALVPLGRLVRSQAETPELADACGLSLLRRPALPDEVPAAERPLLAEAGRAYCSWLARRTDEARRRFEALLERYPAERHLHYGHGLVLAQQGAPEAPASFRRETELFPDHALAHLELAFSLLQRGDPGAALPAAEAAVRLAPGVFASHLALGRALVETGSFARGVAELEAAAKLAPNVPETFLHLGNAYARAGRERDADGARQVFRTLDAARRRPPGTGPAEGP
jgi:tetratricopeptide (TPR) repeat protein